MVSFLFHTSHGHPSAQLLIGYFLSLLSSSKKKRKRQTGCNQSHLWTHRSFPFSFLSSGGPTVWLLVTYILSPVSLPFSPARSLARAEGTRDRETPKHKPDHRKERRKIRVWLGRHVSPVPTLLSSRARLKKGLRKDMKEKELR